MVAYGKSKENIMSFIYHTEIQQPHEKENPPNPPQRDMEEPFWDEEVEEDEDKEEYEDVYE